MVEVVDREQLRDPVIFGELDPEAFRRLVDMERPGEPLYQTGFGVTVVRRMPAGEPARRSYEIFSRSPQCRERGVQRKAFQSAQGG